MSSIVLGQSSLYAFIQSVSADVMVQTDSGEVQSTHGVGGITEDRPVSVTGINIIVRRSVSTLQ